MGQRDNSVPKKKKRAGTRTHTHTRTPTTQAHTHTHTHTQTRATTPTPLPPLLACVGASRQRRTLQRHDADGEREGQRWNTQDTPKAVPQRASHDCRLTLAFICVAVCGCVVPIGVAAGVRGRGKSRNRETQVSQTNKQKKKKTEQSHMSISEGQGGDCCLVTCRREPAVALSIENTHAHSKAQKKKKNSRRVDPPVTCTRTQAYTTCHTCTHAQDGLAGAVTPTRLR